MKKLAQRLLIITAVAAISLQPALASYTVNDDAKVISSTKTEITFEVVPPELTFVKEMIEGKEFSRLTITDWGSTGEVGKPELPVLSRIIALPNIGGVRYSVEIIESEVLQDIVIYPLQEDESDNPKQNTRAFQQDDTFYSKNVLYPAESVRISEPVIMRDMRMAQITFAPLRYNPAKRELTIIKKMRVSVEFNRGEGANEKLHQRSGISSAFAPLYRSAIVNFEEMLDEGVEERGGYIFVVTNSSYASQIQPLVNWKKEKGYPVDVVQTSVIGTSKESIKNYISNAYFNWEIPPEFVVLVGDQDGSITIATDHFDNGWFDNSVTDHYYAKLEGNDYFPEIFVGRLSVRSSTELATVMNKLIYYESTPYQGTDWTKRALMIADYSDISCKLTKQFVKSRCLANGYTQVDTAWFSSSAPTTTINNSINNGVGIVNFRGYIGWGGYDASDVLALSNNGKPPIVFGCTCETGSFEITTCISEAWLRAGTPTVPKGGIGSVGPSSWDTHTRFNNVLDSGFGVGLLDENLEYYMAVINRGKLELWNCFPFNHYGNNTSTVESYYHTYNLIGDPGLSIWTATPEELNVDIPGDVPLGTNYYSVVVEDESGNPVEGAYVNLWKGNEVFVGGYTDENGAINLPFEAQTAGEMKLCVTGQNLYPYRETVNIIAGELFVGIIDHEIDDDNSGSSSGNDDGVMNPGETIELNIRVQNFGSTSVNDVEGEISVDNPYVAITTGMVDLGDLNAGSTAWSANPFVFSISPECPHLEYLEFHLNLTDALNQEWNSILVFEVETADLVARGTDLPGAGANGLLDPGETSTMTVNLENHGTYASETLTGTITCESEFLEILDFQGTFQSINPGGQGTNTGNPFELHALMGVYPGTPVTLTLALSGANGFRDTTYIELDLGEPSASDPLVPDEYGYYCYDDADLGYTPAPIYSWVEISGLTSPLSLPDYGEDQDCNTRAEFPPEFTFVYYGQDYDIMTVCSNGWAAFGATPMCNFRNWPITAAQVAPACLAAFWDDLVMTSGGGSDGKVYAYFDQTNHRFIIEWKNVSNRDAGYANECFEIILYDPIYYTTPTGDGIIDFQYQTVNNNGSEHNSTVGIVTPDNGDGVQYTYAGMYPPGATQLHNNMAIRFTTQGNIGYEPPVISVDPEELTIEIPPGGSGFEPLTIENSGSSTLVYSITVEWEATDEMGGPDGFGYTWIDSDEPSGPDYGWIDISGIGTPIIFAHNDSTTDEMPIGFTFPFYGQMFDEYILSANGWISFTSHMSSWSNTTLPNSEAPPNLITGFWDDLDPLQPGAEVIFYSNNEDSLIVSFLETPHWGSTTVGTYTFQMILTANGGIKFQYQSLAGNYESCTVGIQNQTGTVGLQVAFNEEYLHENLAVEIIRPFLKAEPSTGMVAPGTNTIVNIFAYGYGLEQGTYSGTLNIESNDPANPQIEVPVTVEVGGGGNDYEVTLAPINPPIQIPPQGGSFQYTASVENLSGTVQQFDFWVMVELPGGTQYGPLLLRTGLNLQPGMTISRTLTQQVPGNAPAGEYYYYANAGVYPNLVVETDGFYFTKTAGEAVPAQYFGWDLTGWDLEAPALPTKFAFRGAKPNPFNPATELSFDLPEAVKVELRIYDILGRQVATLQEGWMPAGSHTLRWNAERLASGVYFMQLTAGKHHATSKLLLLK